MKDLLYCAIVILLLFILYNDRSIENVVVIAVSCIILMLYAYQFRVTKAEHFSTTTTTASDQYNDVDFEEIIPENIENGLVYYVSSFDKKYIDFANNALVNVVNKRLGALLTQDIANFPFDYYSQYDGIKITQKVDCVHALKVLESFDTFSIFWYMKLGTSRSLFDSETNTNISLVQFDHENLSQGFNLFEINCIFEKNMLNPSIRLTIADQNITRNYTYTVNDYYENKIFADKQYHLFTFVKDSGKYHFYVDDYVLFECVEDNCIDSTRYTIHPDDNAVNIRDTPIRLKKDNNSAVPLYINAFGIYQHRALSFNDVKELHAYYTNIKRDLSPHYNALLHQNKELKHSLSRYTKPCPFSDETVCSSSACHGIQDWNNVNEIVGNTECLKQVVNYCNSLTDTSEDTICRFLNQQNIFSIASKLDSNLFMYNPNNAGNLRATSNVEVLQKLDRLGLKNIYLDKSYRDTQGRYSGEMNRLINDLLSTNQTVNLDTLNALYDSQIDTRVTNDIEYDSLFRNMSDSNLDYTNMYNDILAQTSNSNAASTAATTSATNAVSLPSELNNDLIDLNYDDIDQPNLYDHVLKKHRQDKIDKELQSSTWNFLSGWF